MEKIYFAYIFIFGNLITFLNSARKIIFLFFPLFGFIINFSKNNIKDLNNCIFKLYFNRMKFNFDKLYLFLDSNCNLIIKILKGVNNLNSQNIFYAIIIYDLILKYYHVIHN